MDVEQRRAFKSLEERLKMVAQNMERMNFTEYIRLLDNPWKLMYINFISGVSRGIGIAVGFAILGAILVIVLQRLVLLNLPVIGGFIADLVEIVQMQLGTR